MVYNNWQMNALLTEMTEENFFLLFISPALHFPPNSAQRFSSPCSLFCAPKKP